MYVGVSCRRSAELERPYLSKDECLECVQNPMHPCRYNGKQMTLMWGTSEKDVSLSFTPTRIEGCLRMKYFEAREEVERILYPDQRWNALRGTLSHSFFEKAPTAPGVLFDITEQRFELEIETSYGLQKFSGQADLIEVLWNTDDEIGVKITDWKSIKDIPHDMTEAKLAHEKQINMYAFLLRECLPTFLDRPGLKVVVDELEIIYFNMQKVRRFTSKGELADQGKMLRPFNSGNFEEITLLPIEMKPHEEVQQYIIKRIERVIDSRENLKPPLKGDESKLCNYCHFREHCWRLWHEEGI